MLQSVVRACKAPVQLKRTALALSSKVPRIPVRPISLFNFLGGSQTIETNSADELFKTVKEQYDSVLIPLNGRIFGPLEKSTEDMVPLPLVLVVGNHSSGKSSFINWVTSRDIQATGEAPTDDTFTLIAPGTVDVDQDGPALIGDPSLGFRGLRQYGTGLINKVQLKIRKDNELNGIMIVDTPGMIDSPVSAHPLDTAAKSRDRGYDFASVVRWFAERADIILLFQDPAKPGTTGETLHIMTTALAGQDFKTFIILNKADQFDSVRDFARAYGALCWNLSKVIPRKDLPPIYTMCVKEPDLSKQGIHDSAREPWNRDLRSTRDEIMKEVKAAPLRRVDNLVTRLYDSARLLKMHAVVLNAARKAYMSEAIKVYGLLGTGAVGFGTLSAALLASGMWSIGAPIAGVTLAGTAAGSWYAQKYMAARTDYYIEGPGLDEAFRRAHYMQLAEKDEFIVQLWDRVRPKLQNCLRTLGFRSAPSARRADIQALDDVIEVQVPKMRAFATKTGALQFASNKPREPVKLPASS